MNYFILGSILASLTHYAFGIQCHQCQTMEYKTCRDPYSVDNLGDCDDDNYCVKYKTIVKLRDSGYMDGWERHSQVVTRSCEPKAGKQEGCIGWQNNGGITLKCWCGTDGCNSGRSLIPTVTSVIVSCVLSLYLLVRII